ncbi:MAG: glycosyltransferase [Coprobacillus sp.]|nr:glycosyltransferase [Coprobacillus sp.]
MKVLVSTPISNRYIDFEGIRFSKSLISALECVGIGHTSDIADKYDVIHLVSPTDYEVVNDAKEKNIPVICSAMQSENDPSCSFIQYKSGKEREIFIENKTLRFLNRMDMVLVPSLEAKNLLVDSGVNSDIKICPPAIDIHRFDKSRVEEREAFYRYFREQKRDLVVCVGDFQNVDGINVFLEIARQFPDILFFYFGPHRIGKASKKVKKLTKTDLKNVKFVGEVPEDIYISALLNAKLFLLPSYKPIGITSLFEAMASKCQIIVRREANLGGFLKEGENAYIGAYSETLVSLSRDYLNGKLPSTVNKAYNEVSQYSLENIGNDLKRIYLEVTNIHNYKEK